MPNLSSGIFDSTLLDGSLSSRNVSDRESTSSTNSSLPGSPLASSSPSKSRNQRSLQNLRFLEVNFQSLFSKRAEFWSLLDAVKPDVMFGCETWLKPRISTGEIFPPDYNVYRRDRPDGWGGLLLGIHTSLDSHQIDIQTGAEFVAAKIVSGKQSAVLASLYRPTNNDLNYLEELINTITNLYRSNPGTPTWIGGDINLPDIEWSSNSIVSHQYPRALNESFLDLLAITGMEQLVDFPTRGDSTLDIFITNRPSLTNTCTSIPPLSDHHVVFMDVDARAHRRKPVKRKIHLWKKADLDAIRHRVKGMSDNFTTKFSATTPVEVLADELQQELTKIIEDCVPSKLSSSRVNQPWFNADTKRALTNVLVVECIVSMSTISSAVSLATGTRNLTCSLIKSKRCDNSGVSPLKDKGFLHSDPKAKANILNNQFTSVFSKDNGAPIPDLGDSQYPPMDAIHVSLNGVIKLLKTLKPHTAAGPDGIPTMLLKVTAEEIAPAITLLFQASIDQGKVPASWKKALIVPLFKKGSRSESANYRPISLT